MRQIARDDLVDILLKAFGIVWFASFWLLPLFLPKRLSDVIFMAGGLGLSAWAAIGPVSVVRIMSRSNKRLSPDQPFTILMVRLIGGAMSCVMLLMLFNWWPSR
jgi:hypothetical protein